MVEVYPRFLGRIKKQHIVVTNSDSFQQYLSSMPEEVEIVVRPRGVMAQRTTPQNKYYWGVVISMLSDEIGYTKEETHELMRHLFLMRTQKIGSIEVSAPKSTSDLTTKEMEEYTEQIRTWAASNLGLSVPTPNETEG